jgi:hypothetical protein
MLLLTSESAGSVFRNLAKKMTTTRERGLLAVDASDRGVFDHQRP